LAAALLTTMEMSSLAMRVTVDDDAAIVNVVGARCGVDVESVIVDCGWCM
jgi:hypothetical protein